MGHLAGPHRGVLLTGRGGAHDPDLLPGQRVSSVRQVSSDFQTSELDGH